jgi:transposase-like protein
MSDITSKLTDFQNEIFTLKNRMKFLEGKCNTKTSSKRFRKRKWYIKTTTNIAKSETYL